MYDPDKRFTFKICLDIMEFNNRNVIKLLIPKKYKLSTYHQNLQI